MFMNQERSNLHAETGEMGMELQCDRPADDKRSTTTASYTTTKLLHCICTTIACAWSMPTELSELLADNQEF